MQIVAEYMKIISVDLNEDFTVNVGSRNCRFMMLQADDGRMKIRFKEIENVGGESARKDGHVPLLDWQSGVKARPSVLNLWEE